MPLDWLKKQVPVDQVVVDPIVPSPVIPVTPNPVRDGRGQPASEIIHAILTTFDLETVEAIANDLKDKALAGNTEVQLAVLDLVVMASS